jgi:hypothetical protein
MVVTGAIFMAFYIVHLKDWHHVYRHILLHTTDIHKLP